VVSQQSVFQGYITNTKRLGEHDSRLGDHLNRPSKVPVSIVITSGLLTRVPLTSSYGSVETPKTCNPVVRTL